MPRNNDSETTADILSDFNNMAAIASSLEEIAHANPSTYTDNLGRRDGRDRRK